MLHVPRVKICGNTSREEVGFAIARGVDALGFLVGLLYPSDDELSPTRAAEMIGSLPPFVTGVLVTHWSNLDEVRDLCRTVHPAAVQLHGDFGLEEIPSLRAAFPYLRIIKVIHVEDGAAVEAARRAAHFADAVLLDTRTETRLGGTGVVHDWSISRRIRDALGDTPVILAGGLTPENVATAIASVRPYGVDVNSGVSLARGKKDRRAVEEFIRIAKAATFEVPEHLGR
jgi:phosphoribosylanthranilate isomerase